MQASQPILAASNLSLGYQKSKQTKPIADQISFSLEKGKLTCLLGPNGVGKSTLIKTIMGQIPAISGSIFLNGKPIENFSQKALSQKISVVLTEKITTGTLNVRQMVELGRIPHTGWLGRLSGKDQQKVEKAIQTTHISYIEKSPLSELSDGQLQKAMIARALAQDGEVLILDEPTAHLDLVNRYEIMRLLRKIALEENKAVLVVTHDLEIAIQTADQFWLMQCGNPLVTGSPEDLIIQEKLNLLLPTDKLIFDKVSGKVQELDVFEYPVFHGPQEIVDWFKLALRKNKLDISKTGLIISLQLAPFKGTLQIEETTENFESIEEGILLLKTRFGKGFQ
ncbi:ABC transporter ATP-binding protein [Fontibacter flavus]|uniref:ABC transporter ATP-binding protein n=1 Tax=Fontibacter flavus TaxID=654838 RepID=A0ABV6FRQ0_9BACT